MEIVVVRHPAVAIEAGICYGQSDVPLAGSAADFAKALPARLDRLGGARVQWIDTSPLSRCSSVASELAAHYGLPAREDTDLLELDYGAWELANWDTVDRAELDAWAADLEHGRPHGGESAAMLAARVERWVADAVKRMTAGGESHPRPQDAVMSMHKREVSSDVQGTPSPTRPSPPGVAAVAHRGVLAITHGGVIRTLASYLLGEPIAASLRRPLGYGALCRFVCQSGEGAQGSSKWTLETWDHQDV